MEMLPFMCPQAIEPEIRGYVEPSRRGIAAPTAIG
jgi:hypothetical protein